ncbi:MAG: hypothetical protein ACP5NV_04965 [Candidatus Woesearchaeota archaeon]
MDKKQRMQNKRQNNFIVLGIALFVVLIVSGCSVGPNSGSNYQKKYYQGYDSLEVQFLDESPPTTFYYDSRGTDNEIPVVVQVKNKGASDAYGAIFIHGYDPKIIEVAGGKLPGEGHIGYNNGVFTIGNIYIGLSGHGSSGNANIGFRAPNGNYYGGSVFTNNGNFVGLNLNVNLRSNRIGSRLADPILQAMTTTYGWSAPISLQGDTPETPGGDMEVYEFPAYIYYLPESLEQFRQPIMVTSCYSYVTRASTMICVDPNPNSNAKKACIAKSVGVSGGQGAPVAITRVEQQATSGKIVLTITVKHSKKNTLDELFDVNYFDAREFFYKCNPHAGAIVKPSDKNIVSVLYVELSGQDITQYCSGGGKVRLDASGNGQFTCTAYLDAGDETTRESPLLVELGYGYQKNIYKEITIKKI